VTFPIDDAHIQLHQRTLSVRALSEGSLDPEKARVARGDRDIGSAMLIDLDQANGARMTFGGPLSRGDRYEEYHRQASVLGYRGFRVRNPRIGSIVTQQWSFALD
jgi:hypothetical protein